MSTNAKSLSVAQRRRETLQRTGIASRRKMDVATPTVAFFGILILTALLVMFGLVMVLSASSVSMLHAGRSPWHMFNRQLFWAFFGVFAMLFTYRMPYDIWRKYAVYIFGFGVTLMLLPFVPGVGKSVNGARAWVGTGVLRFQPSEFLKISMLLIASKIFTDRRK